MSELLFFLVAIFFWVVFGHAMWLLAAAFFRAVAWSANASSPTPIKPKPRPAMHDGLQTELRELVVTTKQLRLLETLGFLDAISAQSALSACESRTQALTQPREEAIADVLPAEPIAPVVEPVKPARIVPEPAPLPPVPKRSWGDVLGAFLEERNILWGELVGGLLIVGCSTALVLSLWRSLEEVPYFPFLLLSAITAAFFGAGEYSLHHWKLASTSRGLLIIALLLTPLNGLVLADPSVAGAGDVAVGSWLDWLVRLAALSAFAGLTLRASRDLIGVNGPLQLGTWTRLTTLAVVGGMAGPLLASPWLDPSEATALIGLALWPAACHFVAVGSILLMLRRRTNTTLSLPHATSVALITLIGLSSFTVAVALGFLVTRAPDALRATAALRLPVGLAGVPILLGGLLLQRRATANPTRVAGTAIGVAGLAIQLSSLALAWPNPLALGVTSLGNALVLLYVAYRYNLPMAHAAALPCLALLFLLVVRGATEPIDTDWTSGMALLHWLHRATAALSLGWGFVLGTILAAAAHWRGGMRDHAAAHARVAGIIGLFCLTTTTLHGLDLPYSTALVYLLCSASALVAYALWRRPLLEYTGVALALAGELWFLQAAFPGNYAVWSLSLAVATLGLTLSYYCRPSDRACRDLAPVAGLLALTLILARFDSSGWHALTCLILSIAAGLATWQLRSRAWFVVAQGMLTASICWAIRLLLRTALPGLADDQPTALLCYGIGIAVAALGWTLVRYRLTPRDHPVLWGWQGVTLDRVLLGATLLGQFLMAGRIVLRQFLDISFSQPNLAGHQLLMLWHETLTAWSLLALLAGVLALNLRERGRTSLVVGLLLLYLTIPMLVAQQYGVDHASLNMLRWGFGFTYFSTALLLAARGRIALSLLRVGSRFRIDSPVAFWCRQVLNVSALVVLVLTVVGALAALDPPPFWLLAPTSIFARIGPLLALEIPLAFLILGCAVHAVRERSDVYGTTGGLITTLAAAGGYALSVGLTHVPFTLSHGVVTLQIVAATTSVCSLLWMYGRSRFGGRVDPSLLVNVQVATGLVSNFLVLGSALVFYLANPAVPADWMAEAGSFLGLAALLIAFASLTLWQANASYRMAWQTPFFIGLLMPTWLAFAGPGLPYQGILIGWPCYLCLVAATGFILRHRRPSWLILDVQELSFAIALASVYPVAVGCKVCFWLDDFYTPAIAAVLMAITCVTLALLVRLERIGFVAAVLVNVAISLVVGRLYCEISLAAWIGLLRHANALGFALSLLAWQGIRSRLTQPCPGDAWRVTLGILPLTILGGEASVVLVAQLLGQAIFPGDALSWCAVLATGLAWLARCRDVPSGFPVPTALYALGLIALAFALESPGFTPFHLAESCTIGFAGYALVASLTGQIVSKSLHPSGRWFRLSQAWLTLVVMALALWATLVPPTILERCIGAASIALLVPTFALLDIPTSRRLALLCTVLAVVSLTVAIPDPAHEFVVYQRSSLLFATLALTGLCYRLGYVTHTEWGEAARQLGAEIAAFTWLAFVLILWREVDWLEAGSVSNPSIRPFAILILVAGLMLVAGLFQSAAATATDRLGLHGRRRVIYVYAAEVALFALFLHLRLTFPELFGGWLARYWTLIVMLLGFLAMGLSEYWERRGVAVLADPLRRTGLLLPLAPLLAYWLQAHQVGDARFPRHLGDYAFLWLIVALLYGVAASLWRAPRLGFVSALAGNFALWSWLAHGDIGIDQHPQLWLIPLALIVLITEHLQRDRLHPDTAASLRYLALTAIYVSSTADLFIAGLGNSFVLPMVLALLSVSGVLVGIALHVRAFLFLGVAFLLVDVLAMIWHAAVDRQHTWVWWLTGIALGTAILALFAVFEKREQEVRRLVERLRAWD